MAITAFQPDAFQINAFQIIEDAPQPSPGKIYRKYALHPPVISGKIEEYEYIHTEQLRAIVVISMMIKEIQKNITGEAKIKYKDKLEIDIETLLIILADE